MNQTAKVHSLDAIRDFRAALQEFCQEARAALVDVDLEVRRGQEWLMERQPAYWRHEVRKAGDAIVEAKAQLHRARMMTLPGGGTPSCMEERKAVERAQQRLRYCEEKVELVREWARLEQHEVAEYEGRAVQLGTLLDGTIPHAISFLDQALVHLESYVLAGHAAGAPAAAPVSTPAEEVAETKATDQSPPVGANNPDQSPPESSIPTPPTESLP